MPPFFFFFGKRVSYVFMCAGYVEVFIQVSFHRHYVRLGWEANPMTKTERAVSTKQCKRTIESSVTPPANYSMGESQERETPVN